MPVHPFLRDDEIELSGNERELAIDPLAGSLRIAPEGLNSYMYINTKNDIKIYLKEAFTLENPNGKINRLIIGDTGNSTVNVKQLTRTSWELE